MMSRASRRERFGHLRKGTGRKATKREFNLTSARENVRIQGSVPLGDDGFEDLDQFWKASGTGLAGSPEAIPRFGNDAATERGKKATAAASSRRPAAWDDKELVPSPSPPRGGRGSSKRVEDVEEDFGGGMEAGGFGDIGGGFEDFGMGAVETKQDDDDNDDDSESDIGRGRGRTRRRGKTSKKDSRKKKRRDALSESEDDSMDSEEEERARRRKRKEREEERKKKQKQQQKKRQAGRKRARVPDSESELEEEDDGDETHIGGAVDRSAVTILSPGGTDLRRVRTSLGTGRLSEEAGLQITEDGVRRSSRRRWNTLKYWEGEHIVYKETEDGVPEAVRAIKEGVLSPEIRKAQAKRRKAAQAAQKKAKRARKVSDDSDSEDETSASASASTKKKTTTVKIKEVEVPPKQGTHYPPPIPSDELPKDQQMVDNVMLRVKDSATSPSYKIAAVRKREKLAFEDLPVTQEAHGDRPLAVAAAAFDTPAFISGTVRLEPQAMKDEEATQECSQVFTVIACQPKALAVTITTHTILLSPGDHFFIPQHMSYSLVNYSKHTEAEVSFVLLKEEAGATQDDEQQEKEN